MINAVRAETKQAISTIYQVGYKNGKPYNDFPNDESKILSFLESFDWSKPWHAGAHFSSICVFNSTQLEKEYLKKIKRFYISFLQKL